MEDLIIGLTRGAVYALVALGYTMVYGILGMINFAHGEVFMIGMFACIFGLGLVSGSLSLATGMGSMAALLIATLFAVVIAAGFGYANERIAYRQLRQAHALAPLTSAIGLSMVLQNFIMVAVSKDPVRFPTDFSDPLKMQVLGGAASLLQLLIIGMSVLLMVALFFLIQKTRIGIAMRATSQDKMMAALVGIPVDRVIAFTFILGSGLAAVAAVMIAMYNERANFDAGYLVGLKAFTAAIMGGIGNIPGAVLGAFLLGITEHFATKSLGSDWANIVAFGILMAVLIVRPRGLLGERVADKV